MDRLIDLIGTSVIVQGLITVIILVTLCYMYATGAEVPSELVNFFAIILGFYFGAKVENTRIKGKG